MTYLAYAAVILSPLAMGLAAAWVVAAWERREPVVMDDGTAARFYGEDEAA